MQLKTGQIVNVVVESIRVFGLLCRCGDGTEVLVRIPDVSWVASFNSCDQVADVGDEWAVKVLGVNQKTGEVSGSIRERFPNPWITSELQLGRIHTATVVRHVELADRCNGPGYLLEIVPGALVMLCKDMADLKPNDKCDVIVTASNPANLSLAVSRWRCG